MVHLVSVNYLQLLPFDNMGLNNPSKDFLHWISQISVDRTVGVQCLSREDINTLRTNTRKIYRRLNLVQDNSITLGIMEPLIDIYKKCKGTKHFVESPKIISDINTSYAQFCKMSLDFSKVIEQVGVKRSEYLNEVIGFSRFQHERNVQTKKMNTLDTIDHLVKQVYEKKLDILICNATCAHIMFREHSNIFTKFSTDEFEPSAGSIVFSQNGNVKPQYVFEKELILRQLEHQKEDYHMFYRKKRPNYIGTWDLQNPDRGYFELFIDYNDNDCEGRIYDNLGNAVFQGNLSNRIISFKKRYDEDKIGLLGVLKGDILYEAAVKNGIFFGEYTGGSHTVGNFLMTSDLSLTASDLVLSYAAKKH